MEVGVRILVTNDDGVRAPGIAALARAARAADHEMVVVAPMIDYSGAGAAVGPVHARDGIDYERWSIDGLEDVPVFAVDAPPALAVILTCVGAFGPPPDVVLSGINHGANVGRSTMHSGTVGAALTGAHFGTRGLAVSIRWGEGESVPWETPARLATILLPVVASAPAGTVLNVNAPDVAWADLRGVRSARLGRGGSIRSAVHEGAHHPDASHVPIPPFDAGTLRLDLTAPWDTPDPDLETDAGLIAADYAALTVLVGVREAGAESAEPVLAASFAALGSAGVDVGAADPAPAP